MLIPTPTNPLLLLVYFEHKNIKCSTTNENPIEKKVQKKYPLNIKKKKIDIMQKKYGIE